MTKIVSLISTALIMAMFVNGHTAGQPTAGIAAFTLDSPSGQFSVSRHWTSVKDSARGTREIPLFIYWPLTKSTSKNSADHQRSATKRISSTRQSLSSHSTTTTTKADGHHQDPVAAETAVTEETSIIPTEKWRKEYVPFLQKRLGDQAAIAITSAKANFLEDAPVTSKEKLPVIFFSHGMNWSTLEYSYIIHEIVSAGFIVIAVNSSPAAPVLQSPAGDFLTAERPKDIYRLVADDLLFAMQQISTRGGELHGVLRLCDFSNVAIAGHSLGGAAALLAATGNTIATAGKSIIKAAINMDGDLMDASQQATPGSAVLFLNQMPEAISRKSFGGMKMDSSVGWRYDLMARAASNSRDGRYISIAGMYHSNFQDYALLPVDVIPENLRKTRLGPVDGRSCLQLISRILITYFDEQLKNKKADWQTMLQQQPAMRIIDIKG